MLCDVGLGGTAEPGMILAGRILRADGFWMTTGTIVPLDEITAGQIVLELVGRHKRQLLDPDRVGPAQRSQIAKRVLRIALDNRCADRVGYANPDASVDE